MVFGLLAGADLLMKHPVGHLVRRDLHGIPEAVPSPSCSPELGGGIIREPKSPLYPDAEGLCTQDRNGELFRERHLVAKVRGTP